MDKDRVKALLNGYRRDALKAYLAPLLALDAARHVYQQAQAIKGNIKLSKNERNRRLTSYLGDK